MDNEQPLVRRIKRTLVSGRNLLFERYHWFLSRRELLDRLAHVTDKTQAIEQVNAYVGHGYYRRLKPDQNLYEITTLVDRVAAIKPRIIVELGTHWGGTLFLWSQISPVLELLVSVDLPGGIHGGGYPVPRTRLYKLFNANHPGCQLELLRLSSQLDSTRARVAELLAGRPIDFLFIDADHRYNGVSKDYALYAPLVRPGGLIAFHDIRLNPGHPDLEVYRLWDELKAHEPHTEEIVHQPFSGRFGIGVVTKSGDPA